MTTNIENTTSTLTPTVSGFYRFRKVFFNRWIVVFGMVVIFIFVIFAIFADLIAPYDPYKTDLPNRLQNPSAEHWLGTDVIGRDTLSRIIFGARTSLVIGLIVVSVSGLIGMTLGMVAGYMGGWAYMIIMRIMDALMSFPMILLAMVIAALLGGGITNVIVALSVGLLPVYTRLMCGQVLTVKENDYILAERAQGASSWRIMIRHLLPNCFPPLIVLITMMLGGVILAEAGLSFLNIGILPPTAAWGSMVNEGRNYLIKVPILSFAPGVAIMLVVFAFNMVGDGLRDALDPRLRGKL